MVSYVPAFPRIGSVHQLDEERAYNGTLLNEAAEYRVADHDVTGMGTRLVVFRHLVTGKHRWVHASSMPDARCMWEGRVSRLQADRATARQAKDYRTSDALRDELECLGVRVGDGRIL